ncbi:MAG: redox-sensing transcriptional repressor Rex [Victivallales bacterium]|jgi:redox-sensing transcriptional repressor|nr:redox-sensing transcriptional repressor Rex [Victivallales bacterium]
MPKSQVFSIPALKRMPAYLRELRNLQRAGRPQATSPILAQALRIDAISVRKDLEMIGAIGSPGIGYAVEPLIDKIENFLGWKNASEAFLVGTGHLGTALLGFRGFEDYGLKIIAAFDKGPIPAGTTVHDVPLFDFSEFRHLAGRLQIHMGILCVPDDAAQEVAEQMVDAGIIAIWNFTAHTLQLPENIIRQKVNLAGDFAVLSVRLAARLRELEVVKEETV